MKKLDCLFVHPNASQLIYQDLSKDHSAIEPSIWAAMLAKSCQVNGFGVAILDCEAERLTIEESAQQIVDIDPKLVCFVVYGQNPNASSQNMSGAVYSAELVKQLNPNLKIIFVGAHVAALPREVLERHQCIDMICQNEGVYTINNLLKFGKYDDAVELKKIRGLGLKDEDGSVILNSPEKLVSNERLEFDLPGLAWELLPNINKYRTSNWHSWTNDCEKSPFVSIYSSLGCRYRCNFCMINIINRTDSRDHITSADSNVFRFWNPDFIITQFDKIADLGVKNVKVADELFVYDPKHFIKICDLLIERQYNFNIWVYSRVDSCKPEYLEKLRMAGVRWMALGVENPDQILRKEAHKGGYKEVKIVDLFNMIRDADICVLSNYIHGLPFDTIESMQYTRDFMMENLTEYMNVYPAQAFPGSPLYLEAKKKGWKLPDRYEGYSMHSYYTQNLSNDNLTASEILSFRDETVRQYFSNPKYLEYMKNKFGQKCIESIDEMMKIKLKRKISEN